MFCVRQLEEDLNTLQKKYANLENDYDKANEGLIEANTKLEASEKRCNEVRTFAVHPLRAGTDARFSVYMLLVLVDGVMGYSLSKFTTFSIFIRSPFVHRVYERFLLSNVRSTFAIQRSKMNCSFNAFNEKSLFFFSIIDHRDGNFPSPPLSPLFCVFRLLSRLVLKHTVRLYVLLCVWFCTFVCCSQAYLIVCPFMILSVHELC